MLVIYQIEDRWDTSGTINGKYCLLFYKRRHSWRFSLLPRVGATFLSVSFSFFFFVLRSFLCLQWNISLDARNRQFLRFPFLMVTGQSCALLHLLLSLILYFSLSLSLSLSLFGRPIFNKPYFHSEFFWSVCRYIIVLRIWIWYLKKKRYEPQ